ncbi:Rpn family recombination-promoting nuclease/putative transposase [Lachnospiraceae bacterium TF09-5]|nr:Rpn family recombination-promoting nuclease/putative transposase [Lachnospiraceae bacterium TF09-5]
MNENSSNKTILEALPEDYTFNLSDFALFLSVMKNKTAYENTLSIILDEPDLRLKEVKVEQVVLNKSGKRAIRLDAWARDEQNRHINTEMQNDAKQDNLRKRSRFYQGLLDTPVLKSGKKTKYKHLPSTIIIFITRDDIFRCDLAMYTFTEQCEEVQGLHLDDGTKKIFLNMTSRNGRPELISLLQYMKNTTLDNPEIIVKDKRIQSLDRIVNEVKQSEEWEAVKMNILEIGIEKGIEQGKAASILELLEETGKVSEQLKQKILAQHDSETLSKWLKLAAKAETIEEFERRIAPDKV